MFQKLDAVQGQNQYPLEASVQVVHGLRAGLLNLLLHVVRSTSAELVCMRTTRNSSFVMKNNLIHNCTCAYFCTSFAVKPVEY